MHELAEFEELKVKLLERVLDASQDCIKIISAKGRLLYINKNGLCAMEIDDFSAFKQKPWDSLWPEQSRSLVSSAVSSAIAGDSSAFEAFCPTAKGTARWWDVRVIPVLADNGISHIVSISRDVTDKVLRDKDKEEHILRIAALENEIAQLKARLAA